MGWLPRALASFLLIFELTFSIISFVPFLGQNLSLPYASATPGIFIDDLVANNNIYYIKAHDSSSRTIRVTAGDGGNLFDLGIDHLPPGIDVQHLSDSFEITIQDVDIPDEQLPASFGVGFNATYVTGLELHQDIVFVIESEGGPQPSIEFDKPTYGPGGTVTVTLTHPHIDCYVHERDDLATVPHVFVQVIGPGFTLPPVQLDRDEFSTNVFRGIFSIPSSASSGQITVNYPVPASSPLISCTVPSREETAQNSVDVSVSEITFDSTSYTQVDDTAGSENTSMVELTITDNSPPLTADVRIEVDKGPEPITHEGQVELEPSDSTGKIFAFEGTAQELVELAGLVWDDFAGSPITIRATYLDTSSPISPEADASVLVKREISFAKPDGTSSASFFTNETATINLVDPVSNADATSIQSVNATLCSYNATDSKLIVGGMSEIPLIETDRDTGIFGSSYQLGFVNGSFAVTSLPDDPPDEEGGINERVLFEQSHIRVLMNGSTVVTAINDSDGICSLTLPEGLSGMIFAKFSVEPSNPAPSDSSGLGQNVGAWAHANPPLATAAAINCNIYGYDTDNDGLCNNWETSSGLKIWYPSGSANWYLFNYVNDPYPSPNHKDILIELDYVDNTVTNSGCAVADQKSWKPSSAIITNLKTAFRTAPVSNPDSINGINLHIYFGEDVGSSCILEVAVWQDTPSTPYAYTYDEIKRDKFGTSTERASTDRGKAKWQAFHYALFIPKQAQDPTSSGVAEQIGNDIVVSLGIGGYFDNSLDEQQGTLMHELGHNLGLYHGGPNVSGNDYNINCKPLYPSVMSYIRQTTTSYSNSTLRYSDDAMNTRYEVPANSLDSNSPNESADLKLSPNSSLQSIQIVWGINNGALMPPPANVGKATWANINWDNVSPIVYSNPTNIGGGDLNMLNISGCTSGDPLDHSLFGANDWGYIQDNLNFRLLNPDSFATGIHQPADEPQDITRYTAREPTTDTIRGIRNQTVSTINALVQNQPETNIIPANDTGCDDPTFSSDKAAYEVGDEIKISFVDSDANRITNETETLKDIKVVSSTSVVGIEVDAEETGDSTGIFQFSFDTSGTDNGTSKLLVSSGDNVTITYTDKCSKDASFQRNFSFVVGIDHHVAPNVTKEVLSDVVKNEFEDRLILSPVSVQKLVLNQTGEPSERESLEKAIDELLVLRRSMDGAVGGAKTDDVFSESKEVLQTVEFLTDSIRSFQFALNTPFEGNKTTEATSMDFDCGARGKGCTITVHSDTAMTTVDTFRIDTAKNRLLIPISGWGNFTLDIPTSLAQKIRSVESATTSGEFAFQPVNGTSSNTTSILVTSPYNPKDISFFYGPDLVSVTRPSLVSLNGSSVHELSVGQQSIISVNLTNRQLALNLADFNQNFTSIFEVRDSDGVTVFIGWETGELPPDSLACEHCNNKQAGLSWTPEKEGDYQVRSFALDSLSNPKILSTVRSVDVAVVG